MVHQNNARLLACNRYSLTVIVFHYYCLISLLHFDWMTLLVSHVLLVYSRTWTFKCVLSSTHKLSLKCDKMVNAKRIFLITEDMWIFFRLKTHVSSWRIKSLADINFIKRFLLIFRCLSGNKRRRSRTRKGFMWLHYDFDSTWYFNI